MKDIKLSILGDSISTYPNYSNGSAADTMNNTIRDNYIYYGDGRGDIDLAHTWWYKLLEKTGMKLCVNNSWSGSCIKDERFGTVGAYIARCVNLHRNVGERSGEEPDVIFIFLGTNDFTDHKDNIGSYDDIDIKTIDENNPKNITEAYYIICSKIHKRYPQAEVYGMNIMERLNMTEMEWDAFNLMHDSLKAVLEHFNYPLVDLAYNSGLKGNDESFNCLLWDHRIHPNRCGMDAIYACALSSLYDHSKYFKDQEKCHIRYELKDVYMTHGLPTTLLKHDNYENTLYYSQDKELKINILEDGIDKTLEYYYNNTININDICHNYMIKASVK